MQTSDTEGAAGKVDDPGAAPASQPTDGAFAELRELVTVLRAAVTDVARLLGLEAQLLVRAAFMVVVLGIILGLVLAAAWIMIVLAIALALQQFTGLGLASATLVMSLLHLLFAFGVVLGLRRLARRLTFPETRLALQTLWGETESGAGAR